MKMGILLGSGGLRGNFMWRYGLKYLFFRSCREKEATKSSVLFCVVLCCFVLFCVVLCCFVRFIFFCRYE